MTRAKILRSGNGQILLIPREFVLNGPEVDIFRCGGELVVREKRANMARAFELLAGMPDDFFPDGRIDPAPKKREGSSLKRYVEKLPR